MASDQEEIDDIEDIVKTFLIGQRMGNLPYRKRNEPLPKQLYDIPRKEEIAQTLLTGFLKNFTVKGLN
jgi:hypothetical protein